MKIMINLNDYDFQFLFRIPYKPSVGERIYFGDFNLKGVPKKIQKDMNNYTSFTITDIAYGKWDCKYKKSYLIAAGDLD